MGCFFFSARSCGLPQVSAKKQRLITIKSWQHYVWFCGDSPRTFEPEGAASLRLGLCHSPHRLRVEGYFSCFAWKREARAVPYYVMLMLPARARLLHCFEGSNCGGQACQTREIRGECQPARSPAGTQPPTKHQEEDFFSCCSCV